VTQYIGELCRYLLVAPPGPGDRKHRVRISIGNGMRPEIWDEYQVHYRQHYRQHCRHHSP
jgi:fatty-acyl-CoA synthase